jgi:hypothetical protein
VQEQLESSQSKYKKRHDKHRIDHHFQIGDQVWLHISKDRLQGEGRKLKPIRYGPFTILDKVGNNAFRLELPPYMLPVGRFFPKKNFLEFMKEYKFIYKNDYKWVKKRSRKLSRLEQCDSQDRTGTFKIHSAYKGRLPGHYNKKQPGR